MNTQYQTFDESQVAGYAVPNEPTKIIHLHRNAEGEVTGDHVETIQHTNAAPRVEFDPFRALTEVTTTRGYKVRQSLMEAALNTPDAAEILRTGIRFLAFSKFDQMQPTFNQICSVVSSTKPQEEYLRDAAVGQLPIAPSGTDAPEVVTGFEGGTTIVNNFYRGLFSVLGDWIRFDQIGKINQFANILGRSLASTREKAAYAVLTTATNYGRNSTTLDNDVGANTAATTFNGTGLELALSVVATAKDRKSGEYLGYSADTIVIGPRMEVPVRMLLTSTDLGRQGGTSSSEIRGQGTTNLYRGMINKIIVSPWFSTTANGYQWLIFDSRVQWCMFQNVMEPYVDQEQQNMTSTAWLVSDKIRFLAATYFGCGIVDDRAAYYSSSTTAPTVA